MAEMKVVRVEIEVDGVWVTFSDGTAAGYLIDELLDLRPVRMETLPASEPLRLA